MSTKGLIQRIDVPALESAAAAAVVALSARPDAGVTTAVLRLEAGRLVSALSSGDTLDMEADVRLLRSLLDEIQSALIARWLEVETRPQMDVVLATLAALESVREVLKARSGLRTPAAAMPDGYEFAAGVAHDLRSPLTSILFLAETLLGGQSGPVNDTQHRQLGIIYSAALGLVSVASDIIELVRGGDGLTEKEPTLFSVTEILESVHDIVRPMAEEKGLGVHLFPPAIDHRLGYPLALSRVLLNLTTNGLKFTGTGFVEIAVRSTSPTRLEFSVRDTGRGYGPEALETLYEPFRLTRAGQGFGFSGTGLGLAISRKLIAAMGATLEVETRPKWGTRFHFEVELPPGPSTGPPAEA